MTGIMEKMEKMEKIKFTKMQAFGNDYVYIDATKEIPEDLGGLAKRMGYRHFGIGSDGIVLLCSSERCDFRMRIFNPDGTEAEMCGNALRSVSKFAYFHGLTDKTRLTVETLGGDKTVDLRVENGQVVDISASIGKPELRADQVPVRTEKERFIDQPLVVGDRTFNASSLSWGNPHTVLRIEDAEHIDVEKYGPMVENMECFPERTNVTFAQPVDDGHIRIREWERGTGETLGCGTGCCSAVVVFNMLGLCGRTVDVEQPGGILHVRWDEEGVVHMTGPSHVVYEGEFYL